MDNRTEKIIDPAPREIRAEMAETRAALTDKLERLECRVSEKIDDVQNRVESTVDMAKETVHETVEKVKATVDKAKDTVHDTVQKVKETFDWRQQMNEHPWTMMGGAVMVGFLVGRQLGPSSISLDSLRKLKRLSSDGNFVSEKPDTTSSPSTLSTYKDRLLQKASTEMHHQISSLENAAVTAAGRFVEGLIRNAVPGIGSFLR